MAAGHWFSWFRSIIRPAIVIALLLSLLLAWGPGSSWAQDDGGGTPVSEILETGGDIPPADTETETEPPPDAELPTETPVVEDVPIERVDTPVEPPATNETPPPEEIEQTAVPTETPTPEPTLSLQQPTGAICELAAGQSAEIAQGSTQDYDCWADLALSAIGIDPATVGIDWTLSAETSGAWTVQLRRDDEQAWSDPATTATLDQQEPLTEVFAAESGTFDTVQTEHFQLRVIRASCDPSPASIAVRTIPNPALTAAGTIEASGVEPDPLVLEPALAAIPAPVASFAGPLDFGTVDATATGPEISELHGTLALSLSGLNTACGAWTIAIGGGGMVDSDGQPLTGSQLLLAPVDASGIPCDVRDGCPVAVVTGDPTADPVQTIPLDVVLQLGDAVMTGSFSTSLTVTITPLDSPPTDGSGE